MTDNFSEDITEVWQRCHAHLQPLAEGRVAGCKDSEIVEVCAHLRVAGHHWIEMARVTFDRLTRRYFWSSSERLMALQAHPGWLASPVDAVDARLWSAQPTMINIEPTTRCNFNCWYCVGRHMKQADIDVHGFAAMLDNFAGLKTIALVGEGEPLLHKDFFVMAQMARQRNIKVMIISNGSAFSRSVIKQLCESGVAYVAISIDSFDPQTFASSRISGDLEKVWQGIRRLRDYRDSHGFAYPKIALKGSLFSHTRDQIPKIVAAAKAHGVEIFESFQPLNPMSSYVKIYPKEKLSHLQTITEVGQTIQRDSATAQQAMQSFASFCEQEGIDFHKKVRHNPIRKNCDETYLYSLLTGDVTPCCQIKTPISPRWNVFDYSVKEILGDPQYENVRFNLWNGVFPAYCDGCWKTR